MEKSRFILYLDQKNLIDKLSDKQAGQLIKAIYEYVMNQTEPNLDPITDMAFVSFKTTLDRDNEKYIAKCNKNRESIEKRWNKTDTNVYEGIQENTNVSKKIQTYKKNTDSDSDRDRDSDKELHKSNKYAYGEHSHVLLTDEERTKLDEEYPNANELIQFLDDYMEDKPKYAKEHKNHYRCIKAWVVDAVNERSKKKRDIQVVYSPAINKELSKEELEALERFRNDKAI